MPGRAQGVTPEEPTAGNLHGGVREGEIPDEPWWTYTGTKLETAATAKESLQLTGSPLLGRSRQQQGLVATCRDSSKEA
jgi:hypothetical protein